MAIEASSATATTVMRVVLMNAGSS
jgi:hypothetical protein